MPRFIADFHIHSKYSRATSGEMDVARLSRYAKKKGITLMGTGDFTHPFYLAELKEQLEPLGNGLFARDQTRFILTAEVCNNFYVNNSGKRIHTVIFAPSFETAERINGQLQGYGRLSSDGRPNLKLSCGDLVKLVLDIDPECLIVPAHIWTPWFSTLGANAGFSSIEECYGDQVDNIYAVETGLSSDPPMNWRLSSLDRFCLISNSDAHSPAKIGREANVFETELDYRAIMAAIKSRDNGKFLFTVEFFPQ
ncbi:endonuclease Q family protein, partial [Candidatus Zixiibacteriota bacterium]